MPMNATIIDNGKGLEIKGHGVLTDQEYLDTLLPLLLVPAETMAAVAYAPVDYSQVTVAELSSDSVRRVAHACAASPVFPPDLVVAHVAPQDLFYGLVRLWEIMTEELRWETMVFRGREEAEAWLRGRMRATTGDNDLAFSRRPDREKGGRA